MKITKDCYVNVLGWTGDEVLQAAEMFAEAISGVVDDIDVSPHNGYIYLMVLESKEVFVGSSPEIVEYGRFVELTKQDIFEDRQQQQPSEWSSEELPPVGTVCEYQAWDGRWVGPSKVFAHHASGGAFIEYIGYLGWDHSPDPEKFRPIKSEKDKEIESIKNALDYHSITYMGLNQELAEHLYNAGFRLTKDSK